MSNQSKELLDLSYSFNFHNYLTLVKKYMEKKDTDSLNYITKLCEDFLNNEVRTRYLESDIGSDVQQKEILYFQLLNFLNNIPDYSERMNFFLEFSLVSKTITNKLYPIMKDVFSHFVENNKLKLSEVEPYLYLVERVHLLSYPSTMQNNPLMLLEDSEFKNVDKYIGILFSHNPDISLSELVSNKWVGNKERIIYIYNTKSRTIGKSSVLSKNIEKLIEKLESINARFKIFIKTGMYSNTLANEKELVALNSNTLYKNGDIHTIVNNLKNLHNLSRKVAISYGQSSKIYPKKPLSYDEFYKTVFNEEFAILPKANVSKEVSFCEFPFFFYHLKNWQDVFLQGINLSDVLLSNEMFYENNVKQVSEEQYMENINKNEYKNK